MKKMLGLCVSVLLFACSSAETKPLEYPSQADILRECEQAILLTDNVEFFESPCAIKIHNTINGIRLANPNVPLIGKETKENTIICSYRNDLIADKFEEFTYAIDIVNYLSKKPFAELEKSSPFEMAEIIKTLFSPPCHYNYKVKRQTIHTNQFDDRNKRFEDFFPTQEELLLDCKQSVALELDEKFLASKCASKINGILGGYSIVPKDMMKYEVCVPSKYFLAKRPAEYYIAMDLIVFWGQSNLEGGIEDKPYLLTKSFFRIYKDKCVK